MNVQKAAEAMAHLYVWDVIAGILEGAATPDRGGPKHRAACDKVLKTCEVMRAHSLEQYDAACSECSAGVVVDEAMVADASRYRFLRGDGGPTSVRWLRWQIQHWTGFWNPVQGAEMDATVDAALAGQQKERSDDTRKEGGR